MRISDWSSDVCSSDLLDLLRLGEVLQVDRWLLVEVDQVVRQAAVDGDLVHVGVGGVEEMPGLRHGDHRHRVLAALGGDGGAFERIEGDVEGRAAGADLLAAEQHRPQNGKASCRERVCTYD